MAFGQPLLITPIRTRNRALAPLTKQIVLDLPAKPPRFTRAAYLVSQSNAAALAMLDAWIASREPIAVIAGPEGSGKTHLARMVESESAPKSPDIVDDAHEIEDPAVLFAAIERAPETGGRILIAGRGAPENWARGLRDLQTRLAAAPRIELGEPDEALLVAVMAKMFADRQLRASERIAAYAAPRLTKTFAAAEAFVAALDALSIEKGRPISLNLAREAVDNLSEAGL